MKQVEGVSASGRTWRSASVSAIAWPGRSYFVMAGLDPAIRRETKTVAKKADFAESRLIAGSSPAMTIRGDQMQVPCR